MYIYCTGPCVMSVWSCRFPAAFPTKIMQTFLHPLQCLQIPPHPSIIDLMSSSVAQGLLEKRDRSVLGPLRIQDITSKE
jgi:hypothetical protein